MLRSRSLSTRVLLPFAVLDVAFQVLVYLGFAFAAGTRESVAGHAPPLAMLVIGGVSSAVWFIGASWHVRSVTRRLAAAPSAPEPELRSLARVVARLALSLSGTWAAKWMLEWGTFAIVAGAADSRPAQVSLLLATFAGPFVLGHALATVVTVAERRSVAALLGARGLPSPEVPSLRARLALYGLGLSGAPSCYLGLLALSPATTSAKLVLVPVFALTVCSWGALCAFLVTSSITARLRPLGDAILAITEAGSVRDARRLPVERADELGHIIRATNDMVARLAEAETSRDRAVADLESLARSLETQVTDRTQEIRLVMQTIAEMYFCVDKDGVVVGTHSLETERRFGLPSPGVRVWDYVGKDDARFAGLLETVWPDLDGGFLPPELLLAQLPTELRAKGATLDVEMRIIRRADGDFRVVVVLRDVTAEHAEAVQRDVAALFAHLAHDRDGVLQFVGEVCRQRDDLLAGRGNAKRTIHTIKGNSAIFGLRTVARVCQDVEEELDGDEPSRDQIHRIRDALDVVLVHVQSVVDATNGTLVVDVDEVDSLLEAVDSQVPYDALAERLRALRYEPLAKPLDRAARAARALAQRLDKAPIETHVEADEIRVAPEAWQALFASFAHAVRNAVDHGLEAPGERAASGKPRAGRVVFSARAEEEGIVLAIGDDGRGIDWDAVRARAAARGLPHDTREDLVEALFADGVTTRDEATEVSGRGVGMSALREAARQLGAEVRVESERGRGTKVSIVVPRDDDRRAPPRSAPQVRAAAPIVGSKVG